MADEIARHRIPGAVVIAGQHGRIVYRKAMGWRTGAAALTPDTLFDLASLTKPIATATATMQLVEQGKLQLDSPAAAYWPEFAANGKAGITVRQLLTHMSGLPADLTLDGTEGKEAVLSRIVAEPPQDPPGSRFRYSDIGYIVLGELVSRISGEPLDRYAIDHIFAPLGMANTGFRPAAETAPPIAPTSRDDGQVQDPTARAMGGVAGHAGLFSTGDDLAVYAEMLLGGGQRKGVRVLAASSVAEMTVGTRLPGEVEHGLGWDVRSPYSAGLDAAFAKGSFGHTGYTGTMVWIEPATSSFLIVLTSRLFPDGKGDARPLRERLASILGSAPPPAVSAGIDQLAAGEFAPLRGKRIALLSNNAARDARGRRTIDRLAEAPGLKLVALFSPEHGLSASREGPIADEKDERTGLPVYSLYGTTRHPADDSLRGLDALVVDLQDAGTRFFTYTTTIAYALEAAHRQNLPVILLDRPDPIGAAIVQGPMLDPALKSFTGYFPLPLRPGMTVGELASMINRENGIGAQLQVVRMRGYRRTMWYDETGRAWTPPSPNLRTTLAATLYPAVGMIEGANVSVGRGTDQPFALIGAPWIDGAGLAGALQARHIPGLTFSAVDFTPTADALTGQLCHGVHIELTDRDRFDAGLAGITIAATLNTLYPAVFDLDATTALVGSRPLVAALRSGEDPAALWRGWRADLEAFGKTRAAYLLYP